MNLYIRIKNNTPVDHPILEHNFKQAFPHIDVADLPPEFARFIRVPKPRVGLYEVNEGLTYEWVGDTVQDVWHIRPMTAEEKAAKIEELMQYQPFPSWVFDETTGTFEPPTPRPDDGLYEWDEDQQAWVPFTP